MVSRIHNSLVSEVHGGQAGEAPGRGNFEDKFEDVFPKVIENRQGKSDWKALKIRDSVKKVGHPDDGDSGRKRRNLICVPQN